MVYTKIFLLGLWKISYAIKNLEHEIESKHEITIGNVLFHMREKEVVVLLMFAFPFGQDLGIVQD
jgi:hypothetical protein